MPSETLISEKLRRDIVVILVIKLSIVLLAALLVFGPRQRPRMDRAAVQSHILSDPPANRSSLP